MNQDVIHRSYLAAAQKQCAQIFDEFFSLEIKPDRKAVFICIQLANGSKLLMR